MKFCEHCGKEILDEAVICVHCGCAVNSPGKTFSNTGNLVEELAKKVKINGIIWLVIAAIQIALGITLNWVLLIVGVLNIISAIQNINYSETVVMNPKGIVAKYKPLTMPVIVLIYNLIFGGIIGVVGSLYYLIGIRSFVLNNEGMFARIEASVL